VRSSKDLPQGVLKVRRAPVGRGGGDWELAHPPGPTSVVARELGGCSALVQGAVPVQHLEIRLVDLGLAGERCDADALRVDRDDRLVMANQLPAERADKRAWPCQGVSL
jgi:hypothetical protein